MSNIKVISQKPRAVRDSKGASLLAVLHDYIVLDIETTGLDPSFEEIINLAALKVRDNKIIETFDSLVRPKRDHPKSYIKPIV